MLVEGVNEKGEQIVGSWLRSNGYFRIFTRENKVEIEADSGMRRIFVYVRTVFGNSGKDELSKGELKEVKDNATKVNREPWVAIVKIHGNDQSNHIQWIDLSKKG